MASPIVTRFAPSPTGFLHIGGGRTALFNWLFAKRMGGTMLLRIEDTDRERSTQAAIDAILDGLKWLGLTWDGEPVYQFARADRHAAIAYELVEKGLAYRCYMTPEEIESERAAAKAAGTVWRYDGRWRERSPSEAPAGVKPVIRLKAPRMGETIIEDKVQGRVVWQNENLDDLVLLRSDGTPTYMLAVVVDDHDMKVTHVIRGDDHLTNAARQTQIYQAMGWDVPVFAHIPLIHGPDGSKLSKRHGALGVEAYRAMGYVPTALRNYLVRLGWSHGDQEIFSTQEMIDAFSLEQIGRSPSRFDFAKLENLNAHYLRMMDDAALLREIETALPDLTLEGSVPRRLDDTLRQRFLSALPGLKERARTLIDLVQSAYYLYAQRPLQLDDKARGLLDAEAKDRLKALIPMIESIEIWSGQHAEAAIRSFAEAQSLKLGQVAQPLRAALTGRATSPGLFDVMDTLGQA
jgi:glutamyl-tRNA synthetase